MWMDLSEQAKNVKALVFHENAQERMTLAEKDFNNQVYRVMLSVGATQPLSPGTALIVQWAFEQSGQDHNSSCEDGLWSWRLIII